MRATLARMLEEVKGHLQWVKHWLDRQTLIHGNRVRASLARYTEADAIVYAQMTSALGWEAAA